MTRHTGKRVDRLADSPTRADSGVTFIELLVAIVLIGTTVIAVLAALRAGTKASVVDADHARAAAWLHDASDAVFERGRVPCRKYVGSGDPDSLSNWTNSVGSSSDSRLAGADTVWGNYNDAVAAVPPPQGWQSASIQISKIEFLQPTAADSNLFNWGSVCFEGLIPDTDDAGTDPDDYRETPLVSQKITLVVRSPNGELTKILETVKADR